MAAGVCDQQSVEKRRYAVSERNGLLADDGDRRVWATAGQQP